MVTGNHHIARNFVASAVDASAWAPDQWCYELGHSLLHYWPDAWKQRWLRIICVVLYTAGGFGAGFVLITKPWRVGLILYRSTSS